MTPESLSDCTPPESSLAPLCGQAPGARGPLPPLLAPPWMHALCACATYRLILADRRRCFDGRVASTHYTWVARRTSLPMSLSCAVPPAELSGRLTPLQRSRVLVSGKGWHHLRLPLSGTQPARNTARPPPQDLRPTCCHFAVPRIYLADPVHASSDDAWEELPDRHMHWAPVYRREANAWVPEWVCLRCNATIDETHPMLNQLPQQPVCATHGPRRLAIDLREGTRGWVCGHRFWTAPVNVWRPPRLIALRTALRKRGKHVQPRGTRKAPRMHQLHEARRIAGFLSNFCMLREGVGDPSTLWGKLGPGSPRPPHRPPSLPARTCACT